MIKRILLSLTILLSLISTSYSQEVKQIVQENAENEMVMQHKDVDLVVGSLKISAPFLYKGEFAPHQGYLIKFKDYIRLQDVVKGCQTSCDILLDTIKQGYIEKIKKCQSDCDIRVKLLQDEKEMLIIQKKDLADKVNSEITKRYVWTIISAVGGAGIGILVYEISR
jgi:hypothetical protein